MVKVINRIFIFVYGYLCKSYFTNNILYLDHLRVLSFPDGLDILVCIGTVRFSVCLRFLTDRLDQVHVSPIIVTIHWWILGWVEKTRITCANSYEWIIGRKFTVLPSLALNHLAVEFGLSFVCFHKQLMLRELGLCWHQHCLLKWFIWSKISLTLI